MKARLMLEAMSTGLEGDPSKTNLLRHHQILSQAMAAKREKASTSSLLRLWWGDGSIIKSTHSVANWGGMAERLRGLVKFLQTMIAKGHSKRMWTKDSWLHWQWGQVGSRSWILLWRKSFDGITSQVSFQEITWVFHLFLGTTASSKNCWGEG